MLIFFRRLLPETCRMGAAELEGVSRYAKNAPSVLDVVHIRRDV